MHLIALPSLPSQITADGGGRRLGGTDGLEGSAVEPVKEAVVLALVGEGVDARHVAWRQLYKNRSSRKTDSQ